MKNSSLVTAWPAVSIEVSNPAPAMAREQDGREPEFEVLEKQEIIGTCETTRFTRYEEESGVSDDCNRSAHESCGLERSVIDKMSVA